MVAIKRSLKENKNIKTRYFLKLPLPGCLPRHKERMEILVKTHHRKTKTDYKIEKAIKHNLPDLDDFIGDVEAEDIREFNRLYRGNDFIPQRVEKTREKKISRQSAPKVTLAVR